MALIIPPRLRCFTEAWRIANSARGGGASLTGQQQFVVSPAGRWEAKMSFHCVEDDDYLEADGFIASLDGPATPFLVGPVDWRGRPWVIHPLSGTALTPALIRRNTGDDAAIGVNPDTIGALSFSLAANVAMNSTALTIQRNLGGALKRGQYLQIGERLHIITGLTTDDPVDPLSGVPIAGQVSVTIRPWTRDAYTAGTPIEMAAPVGLMRLTAESSAMVERTTSPLSGLSLDLVEAF
ncbi:hypothetical protein FPV16_23900 [Methylobacterium sp. W2]|uniref:hypothetical protein n=1 Tax=Methylobacterium sp. W2 TaxID=2598107 RepID=UPI001D0C4E3C|nr:hypothetical protein [Methylobacterium sp. W2]MCC0809203.1 hypothetical protein [Methylobacterium sp. W2]